MNEVDWKHIKKYLKMILSLVYPKLEKSSIEYIEHYIKHDEFEIAFEILFTEIIKLENLPLIDYSKAKEIGKSLKLDEETVFNPEFWNNLIKTLDRP